MYRGVREVQMLKRLGLSLRSRFDWFASIDPKSVVEGNTLEKCGYR